MSFVGIFYYTCFLAFRPYPIVPCQFPAVQFGKKQSPGNSGRGSWSVAFALDSADARQIRLRCYNSTKTRLSGSKSNVREQIPARLVEPLVCARGAGISP